MRAEAPLDAGALVAAPRWRVSGTARWHALVPAAGAVLLGLAVRLAFFLPADFPLHDGGLFYAMVRTLEAGGYALPSTVPYNGEALPFAYPPLAFYLAAALDRPAGADLFDLFRWLPLALNVLTVAVFARLASLLLRGRAAGAAAFAFAVSPDAFQWLIMGGGLTRSLGFLCALVALVQAVHLGRRPGPARAAVFGLASGLTLLSHPQWAFFVAYSAPLLLAASPARWVAFRWAIASGVVAAVVSAPWWLTVALRHGAGTLVEPFRGNQLQSPIHVGVARLLLMRLTGEVFFPVVGALAWLGVARAVANRAWLLPAWVVVAALLDQRYPLQPLSVPAALLAGEAVARVLAPLLARLRASEETADAVGHAPAFRAACALLVVSAALGAAMGGRDMVAPLPAEERVAMAWVGANTPPDSRVLVVTGAQWGLDTASEWFPVLARRVSVGTVQGSEWLPDGEFGRRVERAAALQRCAAEGAGCLRRFAVLFGVDYSHVYISRRQVAAGGEPIPCCGVLAHELQHDPDFELVAETPGALVFRRVGPASGSVRPAAGPSVDKPVTEWEESPTEGATTAEYHHQHEHAPPARR